MSRSKCYKSGFTLIELLVVIAIIAILASILMPVFATARERARMASCVSNCRQIGLGLRMYTQDFDETFPCIVFEAADDGNDINVWRNAVQPYIKNKQVFACPSNPLSKPQGPGGPGAWDYNGNGEGWHMEPDRIMPRGYAMNSCANSWLPYNQSWSSWGQTPLTESRITRPADTIAVGELSEIWVDVQIPWLYWGGCTWPYQHMGGHPNGPATPANWVFLDGHVKSLKWAQTIYPINRNMWVHNPNPDPNNTQLVGEPGCDQDLSGGIVCPAYR